MEWLVLVLFFTLLILAIVVSNKWVERERQYRQERAGLIERFGTIEEQQAKLGQLRCAIKEGSVTEQELRDNLSRLEAASKVAMINLEKAQTEDLVLRKGYEDKNKVLEEAHQAKSKALDDSYTLKLQDLQKSHNEQMAILNKQLQESYGLKQQELSSSIAKLETEYNNISKVVQEQQTILQIALEQNRLEQENEDRYYLNISASDRAEIAELMDICAHLRNPLPLYKAIYDIYYKMPLGVLLDDLGMRGKTGIYKLTDSTNGKMYIGQSVDVGERWRQHIKRGCKAEVGTISGSKLYSAMAEHGIWHFKFELLQECSKEELNKLEKFWINHFNSIEYGYNMKAGG